jgi:hypothetical protein
MSPRITAVMRLSMSNAIPNIRICWFIGSFP